MVCRFPTSNIKRVWFYGINFGNIFRCVWVLRLQTKTLKLVRYIYIYFNCFTLLFGLPCDLLVMIMMMMMSMVEGRNLHLSRYLRWRGLFFQRKSLPTTKQSRTLCIINNCLVCQTYHGKKLKIIWQKLINNFFISGEIQIEFAYNRNKRS